MNRPGKPADPERPQDAGRAAPSAGSGAGLDPSASAADQGAASPHGGGARAGRFWSKRRLPAVLISLVVLGAAGLLLYDLAAVRAGRPAMHWRRVLAGDLAKWRLDDVGVLAVAAAVMLIGLWLIVVAVTPGLRSLLPMRRDRAHVRACLHRDAAALVLRDRAMEVSGVQSVRVRMRRNKASVRAQSHFRDLDDVRADLETAVGAGLRELGLARPPALSVRVGRPAKKG